MTKNKTKNKRPKKTMFYQPVGLSTKELAALMERSKKLHDEEDKFVATISSWVLSDTSHFDHLLSERLSELLSERLSEIRNEISEVDTAIEIENKRRLSIQGNSIQVREARVAKENGDFTILSGSHLVSIKGSCSDLGRDLLYLLRKFASAEGTLEQDIVITNASRTAICNALYGCSISGWLFLA